MANEESGLFVLFSTIGGAVIGALGGALIMNSETGKRIDAHLSTAYKTLKENLPRNKSNKRDIIIK